MQRNLWMGQAKQSSFSPAGPQLSTGKQASCRSGAIKPAADTFIAHVHCAEWRA